MTTAINAAPRIWVGCLHCYNCGRLVGDWFDATDAADLTPEDIHGRPVDSEHDEIWVFDHDLMGVTDEMDLMHAARIAAVYEECEDRGIDWELFLAYCDHNCSDPKENDPADFEDYHLGQYADFETFAYQDAKEALDQAGIPEDSIARRYFNYDQWENDLKMDYFALEDSAGKTHIFYT